MDGKLVMMDGEFNTSVVGGPLTAMLRHPALLAAAEALVGGPVKLTGSGYLDGGRCVVFKALPRAVPPCACGAFVLPFALVACRAARVRVCRLHVAPC